MKKVISIICLAATLFAGCKKDAGNTDMTYPTIDLGAANTFPTQCAVIKKGENFTLRFTVNDNVALGAAGIDIHQNFDHHNHGTEVTECTLDPKKTPVKPFVLVENFTIPEGKKTYVVEKQIAVPADVDAGDYHFMLKVTDKSGWQTIKGLSVKIK